MNDKQRQLVFDVLVGNLRDLPLGDPARLALECFAASEVNELEPVIDRMLDEARRERRAA